MNLRLEDKANTTSLGQGRVTRYIPAIFVMAIIFTLSHQPGDSVYLPKILGYDKLGHFFEYAVLATTCVYAALRPSKLTIKQKSLLITLFCLIFGISDELHQYFIPLRTASIFDVMADVAGSFAVVLTWIKLTK